RYTALFNSYYNALGEQYPRAERGLLSRPTVAEVYRYRTHVDNRMHALLDRLPTAELERYAAIVEIGVNHEEQHQELIVTDLKHVLSKNPLEASYGATRLAAMGGAPPLAWRRFAGGLVSVGFAGAGFAYDNETPSHRTYLQAFEVASRLVTCRELL